MLSAVVIAQSSARVEAAPIAIVAPSGLANGQKFRIMVVTSAVTNAFSTDINYYNGFVSGALDYTYLGPPSSSGEPKQSSPCQDRVRPVHVSLVQLSADQWLDEYPQSLNPSEPYRPIANVPGQDGVVAERRPRLREPIDVGEFRSKSDVVHCQQLDQHAEVVSLGIIRSRSGGIEHPAFAAGDAFHRARVRRDKGTSRQIWVRQSREHGEPGRGTGCQPVLRGDSERDTG